MKILRDLKTNDNLEEVFGGHTYDKEFTIKIYKENQNSTIGKQKFQFKKVRTGLYQKYMRVANKHTEHAQHHFSLGKYN